MLDTSVRYIVTSLDNICFHYLKLNEIMVNYQQKAIYSLHWPTSGKNIKTKNIMKNTSAFTFGDTMCVEVCISTQRTGKKEEEHIFLKRQLLTKVKFPYLVPV